MCAPPLQACTACACPRSGSYCVRPPAAGSCAHLLQARITCAPTLLQAHTACAPSPQPCCNSCKRVRHAPPLCCMLIKCAPQPCCKLVQRASPPCCRLVQRAPPPCCSATVVQHAACAPPPTHTPTHCKDAEPAYSCLGGRSNIQPLHQELLYTTSIPVSHAKFTPAGSGAGPFEQNFEIRSMLRFSMRIYEQYA